MLHTFFNTARRRGPIGLELGSDRVRLVHGVEAAGRIADERPLPESASMDTPAYHAAAAEAVAAAVAERGIASRRVVSAAPVSLMQVKNLRLPPMPATELAEAVRWEARDQLSLDADAAEVCCFNAGEVRQGAETRQEVILLATPRRFIDSHIESFAAHGFEVVRIDAPMAALARAVLAEGSDAPAEDCARLIVHVDEPATQVVIIRGRRIVFFKMIDFGLAALRQAWQAGQARVDDPAEPDEAALRIAGESLAELVRELGLCLRYYSVTFGGERPDAATLTGPGAMPWLGEQIARQASLHVRRFEPVCPGRTLDAPAWGVAIGLAGAEALDRPVAEGRAA